jgi:hypothetical protein
MSRVEIAVSSDMLFLVAILVPVVKTTKSQYARSAASDHTGGSMIEAAPRAVTVGAFGPGAVHPPAAGAKHAWQNVVVERRSKRYTEAAKGAITEPVALDKAVTAVKAFKATKFDQSVELIFSLGIDPKQADQMIRGSLSLPHGIGKSKRVVAFCPDHLAPVATAAGAVRAGGQELVAADREGELHRLRRRDRHAPT